MHAPRTPPIPVDMLLLAYRNGIFPMADTRDDPDVFWVEPRRRAIIPLDEFRCSRSLRKVLRQDRYRVTFDSAFAEVIEQCAAPRAAHEGSWISHRIQASYLELHDAGHAHSVECWRVGTGGTAGAELVGGLYGVAFDRVFCGESMFSRADDASKVALAWLVALMRRAGYRLLDCQFMTDHLASLGAAELPQADYLQEIAAAHGSPKMTLAEAYSELLEEAGASSPGKLIAQSFTHTS